MFSSFSGRLNDLEQNIKQQEEQISELHNVFGIGETKQADEKIDLPTPPDSVEGGERVSEQSFVDGDWKKVLLRLHGKIKQTDFKVNGILGRLAAHEKAINNFKLVLPEKDPRDIEKAMAEATKQENSGKFPYNPHASEFKPSTPSWTNRSPRPCRIGEDNSVRTLSPITCPINLMPPLGKDGFAAILKSLQHEYAGSESDSPRYGKSEFTTALTTAQVGDAATYGAIGGNNQVNSPREHCHSPGPKSTVVTVATASATHTHSDPAMQLEMSRQKRRIQEMEAEMRRKDQLIQDLISERGLPEKEKEVAQKQDWFEHKMRLLKQDKRRRGETIGKLLRCIDDMKDQGRVDETKVTEGRFVLQATLASRGWPVEDRVKAAVQAMEAERAAQRAQLEADMAATACEARDADDVTSCMDQSGVSGTVSAEIQPLLPVFSSLQDEGGDVLRRQSQHRKWRGWALVGT